jgi:hypothetical protein
MTSQLYRVAQKTLDTTCNILNIECQLNFAPPCDTRVDSKYPEIFSNCVVLAHTAYRNVWPGGVDTLRITVVT